MDTGQHVEYLDGNAAAGPLQELFRVEITTMTAQCDGCGDRAVLAQARVYNAEREVSCVGQACNGWR